MSYLDSNLRLHFNGLFQATVSTVNNDVTHFDNSNFRPEFRERGTGANLGWWNPNGNGAWRLLGCGITSAYNKDGSTVKNDPVLHMQVADTDRNVPAKIVDLDPQQQMVSEIWGMEVRIADASGQTVVRGQFEVAAFTDLWLRLQGISGDMGMGAMWQSKVKITEWGDLSASPFLQDLKAASASGFLSMKFNVDKYSMDWNGDQFCRGRIVGTIGPACASEPSHFVLGRQLLVHDPSTNTSINYAVAVHDETSQTIRIDLGNALPIASNGEIYSIGPLTLAVLSNGSSEPIGPIEYTRAGWYTTTAGILNIPVPPSLADTVKFNPLVIIDSKNNVLLTESNDGGFVRADTFVFRASPKDPVQVTLYATRFGKPFPKAVVELSYNSSQLQAGPGEPTVATPPNAVVFPDSITADDTGKALLPLTLSDPGNPRGYIDGQVYGVGYALAGHTTDPDANPSNFVSILLFDAFTPDSPPTWTGCIQPIFQQYANLYPVMARFLDMGSYEQVAGFADQLQIVFDMDISDPNSMPVTRDLSPAKRQTILTWLKSKGPHGLPLKSPPDGGTAAPSTPSIAACLTLASAGGKGTHRSTIPTVDPHPPTPPNRGGKTEAMRRMLKHRTT